MWVEAQDVVKMASAMASQSTGWSLTIGSRRIRVSQLMTRLGLFSFSRIRLGHRAGGGGAKAQAKQRRPHEPDRQDETS